MDKLHLCLARAGSEPLRRALSLHGLPAPIFNLFQSFLARSLGTLLHLMPRMKRSGLSHARRGAVANNHTCFTMTGSSLRALHGQADCLWSLELGRATCCAPKPSAVAGGICLLWGGDPQNGPSFTRPLSSFHS